jgi:hypothetical protein
MIVFYIYFCYSLNFGIKPFNIDCIMFNLFRVLVCLGFFFIVAVEASPLYLRDNLKLAKTGDYIVTAQNKNYTLLHIYDRKNDTMTIEEITVPSNRFPRSIHSWKQWISQRAPGNTSWVMYTLNVTTGQMLEFYSLSKNAYYDTSQADSFLTTLLNLRLDPVLLEDRKRVGIPPFPGMTDRRPFWQPRMIVDGQEVRGVAFSAWQTEWPRDGSDLEGKFIEVYVPEKNDFYPSYFPYWLQISGMIGSAKIRIVDSGSQMQSPAPPIESRRPHPINHP